MSGYLRIYCLPYRLEWLSENGILGFDKCNKRKSKSKFWFILNRKCFGCFAGIILLVLTTFANIAHAQNAQKKNEWGSFPISISYSGMGFTKEQRDKIDTGELVYTTSTTTSGLLFSCVNGDLMVAVSLKPQDFTQTFNKTTRRHKGRNVKMSLNDGAKTDLGTWILKPRLGGLSSLKSWQAARLYNAVVRQQSVTLFVQRQKPVVLDIPKINSVFADFGSECGLGRNKQ